MSMRGRVLAVPRSIWVIGLFILIAVGAASFSIRGYDFCTKNIISATNALRINKEELQVFSETDLAARCPLYRKRVEILTWASPVMETCGPAQATKRSASPALDGELSFYKRLVEVQCR